MKLGAIRNIKCLSIRINMITFITHIGPVKPSYNVGKAKAKFGNEQARFFVWRAHLHPSAWVIVAIVILTCDSQFTKLGRANISVYVQGKNFLS